MDVDGDQEDEEDAEYKHYLATLEGGKDKDAAARPAKRRRQRFEPQLPCHSPTSLAEDVATPIATPTKRHHGRDAATPGTPLPSPEASASTAASSGAGAAMAGEGPLLLEHKLAPLSSSTSLCEGWAKLLRGPVAELQMDSGLLSRVRVSLEAALGLIKTLADGSSVKELLVKAKVAVEAVVLQVSCRVAAWT